MVIVAELGVIVDTADIDHNGAFFEGARVASADE